MAGRTRRDTETNWQAQAGVGAPGDVPTRWTAYLIFSGVLIALVGLFHAMAGVTALVNPDTLDVSAERLFVNLNYDVWGWAHIVLGVVGMVTAYLLLRGDRAGRLLAVAVCGISALVSLAFLAAEPGWSAVVIAFDVLVIYAVTVHGEALPPEN